MAAPARSAPTRPMAVRTCGCSRDNKLYVSGPLVAVKSTVAGPYHASVLLEPVIRAGKARWSLRIEKGSRIVLGVAMVGHNVNRFVGGSAQSWGYSMASGNKCHDTADDRGDVGYAQPFRVGDTVDLEIDADAHTLTFFRNGLTLGSAFSNLPGGQPYNGVVSLLEQCACVTVLRSVQTSSRITVSQNGRTFTKQTRSWDEGMVLVGGGAKTGRARWSFRIGKGSKTTIGVCAEGVRLDGYLNKTTSGWGYYQANGNKGHGGAAQHKYGASFKTPGDVVDVEVDCDAHTATFYLNGVSQGVAYDNLPADVRFFAGVSLYDKGDHVTLLPGVTPPTSKALFTGMEAMDSFSLSRHGEGVAVSADCKSVHKLVSGWQAGIAMVGAGVKTGRARWSFRIGKGSKTTVGVCAEGVRLDGYLNKTTGGWGYYQANGNKGHGGAAQHKYGASFKTPGDVVDVEVDCDAHTATFYLNGVSQGVAYDNLPADVRFFAGVSLYGKGDHVTILSGGIVAAVPKAAGSDLGLLDPVRSGSSVEISPDLRSVTKATQGWGHGIVMVGEGVRAGRARWAFRLDRSSKATVGVCLQDVDLSGFLNKTTKGWGYYQSNGNKGHGGAAAAAYGAPFKTPGDIVEVEVDCDKHELSFFKNGERQGVAYTNLPADVRFFGAASLYGAGDTLTLLSGRVETGGMPRMDLLSSTERGKHVVVSSDCTTASKRTKGWDEGIVLVGAGVKMGRARWSFRIGKGSKTTVGVCAEGVRLDGYLNKTTGGWGYYQANGNKGHGGAAQHKYGASFKTPGDVVDVEVDCDAHTATFYLNGVSQGVAYDNLPADVRFFAGVSLYGKGDHVTILSGTKLGEWNRMRDDLEIRVERDHGRDAEDGESEEDDDDDERRRGGAGERAGVAVVEDESESEEDEVEAEEDVEEDDELEDHSDDSDDSAVVLGLEEDEERERDGVPMEAKVYHHRDGHVLPEMHDGGLSDASDSGDERDRDLGAAHGVKAAGRGRGGNRGEEAEAKVWAAGEAGDAGGDRKRKKQRARAGDEDPANAAPSLMSFAAFPIREFFDKLGAKIAQYHEIFEDYGFTSVIALSFATQEDMKAMAIKRGHQRVLLAAIEELRTNRPPFEVPETTGSGLGGEAAVESWLRSLHFREDFVLSFLEILTEDGFDTMTAIATLTAEDLEELGGTKVGHRRLLQAAIQDLSEGAKKRRHSLLFGVGKLAAAVPPLVEGDLPLYIKKLDGTSITINVMRTDDVLAVKQRISRLENVPVSRQMLIFAGRRLADKSLLSDHAIQKESTIQLIVR